MPTKELGTKLIRYMKSKGWRVKPFNIVYLEDVNIDTWQPVQGRLNYFDDARVVVTDDGDVLLNNEATCEPGSHYTFNPMNAGGAFRIVSDKQFLDAWCVGWHKKQYALVQVQEVEGYRDFNKDGIRTGDKISKGLFGVNQHTTGNDSNAAVPSLVGAWSAGCLVGKHASSHYNRFLPLVKSFGWDSFDTAIVPGDKFAVFQ